MEGGNGKKNYKLNLCYCQISSKLKCPIADDLKLGSVKDKEEINQNRPLQAGSIRHIAHCTQSPAPNRS